MGILNNLKVLQGVIRTTAHLTMQEENHIYLKVQEAVQKYLQLDIIKEGMWKMSCKGNLEKINLLHAKNKKGEDVEAWMLGMRKYLQLHNYSSNMESRISIYNLQCKSSMLWDQLVQVKNINEREFYGDTSRSTSRKIFIWTLLLQKDRRVLLTQIGRNEHGWVWK